MPPSNRWYCFEWKFVKKYKTKIKTIDKKLIFIYLQYMSILQNKILKTELVNWQELKHFQNKELDKLL